MSTIESSVTRLLVATKHLLESLTQWAKKSATETDISDSYVQLGNEFKVACRAFSNAGVDVTDLGDVPHSLRVVLEEALCEPPSQESLDKFLPTIREIIVTLLQNLKNKQAMVRSLRANRSDDPNRAHRAQEDETHKRSVSNSSAISGRPSASQNEFRSPAATNNALLQLQKGDSLQRRASRRFSAYQYAKLTNYSPGRDPELPIDRGQVESRKGPGLSSLQLESTKDVAKEGEDGSINVFLKIEEKVKKAVLSTPVSFTSLRLLFVEKFAYSPGSGSFPDIYIQDNVNGVSYMLEEHLFSDIKEGSIISLSINKTDDFLRELKTSLQSFQDDFKSKYDQFTQSTKEYVEDSNKNMLDKLDAPLEKKPTRSMLELDDMSDLIDIRHEVSVIKQINNTNKASFKSSVEQVLQKVNEFKALSFESSKSSNRAYMEESHQKLSTTSDGLLTKFDDLQDVIEALRKDVAQRGSRPSQKQLEHVSKQITDATSDLDTMVKYISTEKPNWKKIWESELDTVCSEQQFLTLQEDLAHDLKEDLEKATETFDLVKQCCEEQSKNPKMRAANLPIPEPGSMGNLRDALLSEVEALRPNHDGRVEAIEKAEKLRQRERQLSMLNGFEEELGGFVENAKLKKSGGIEEVERVRKMKDEQNLRSNFAPF
ncbi:hypothetical protein WICANDRAFT_31850 [Wickerhamomyces anomalus NRRL Y-366-8]|uniref:Actin interacting protein 3 C-terminal domain-containing protein n=1 Tax=Wickerhamomyces anomalus (strain ATCC 58044 / CBS 1984 / NCYC 433 / NRRL Y-366-8) TaxID=683960 RepID=A0A1E3P1P5_WICAA|nr:uncharacterized protein WICANDRAFT_31850 [Wickerhamomyces anomalus NRRL Y-366-8]ODQ59170.1 hypothetical protein WICANDRAFT_31850 [Wickerhamomyces anomalus NRRL Y-366-8]